MPSPVRCPIDGCDCIRGPINAEAKRDKDGILRCEVLGTFVRCKVLSQSRELENNQGSTP